MNNELKAKVLRQHTQVSLESGAIGFNPITAGLTRMLETYVVNIKEFFHDLLGPVQPGYAHFSGNAGLNRLIKNSNYTTLTEILVYVPAGLSVPYLRFNTALGKANIIASLLVKDVLKPANTYVAQLLGNPEHLSDVSFSEAANITMHGKAMDDAKADMSKCFGESLATQVRFSQAFRQPDDFGDFSKALEGLNTDLTQSGPKEVNDLVESLIENTEKLIKRVKEQPDRYGMIGRRSQELSDVIMKAAQEVEFYAAHQYMMQMTNTAMADNIKKLQGLI